MTEGKRINSYLRNVPLSDPLEDIKRLFLQGEGTRIDFKEKIDDPQKIATSISAFANTLGGDLIVGVKDTGGIRGINPEDEKYMLEKAAKEFVKPPIELSFALMGTEKKKILKCSVPQGGEKPYLAKSENGWRCYYRVDDNTVQASKTLRDILKKRASDKGTIINYSEHEQWLLTFLSNTEKIDLKEFSKARKIPFWKSSKILTNLVAAAVLKITVTTQGEYFSAVNNLKAS